VGWLLLWPPLSSGGNGWSGPQWQTSKEDRGSWLQFEYGGGGLSGLGQAFGVYGGFSKLIAGTGLSGLE